MISILDAWIKLLYCILTKKGEMKEAPAAIISKVREIDLKKSEDSGGH